MKFLFVGERRSKLAKRMGVTWRDGRLAAKQLFDALRAIGINPLHCGYCNIFERDQKKWVRRAVMETVPIIAMGRKVQSELRKMGVEARPMTHPAARGAIRKKERYIQHVKEVLK